MEKTVAAKSASALIDERIRELGDWRGKTLAKHRPLDQSELEFRACVCQHPCFAPQSADKGCQVAVVHRAHDVSHDKSLPGPGWVGVGEGERLTFRHDVLDKCGTSYHVVAFHTAKREVLENAEVHRGQCGCVQRISAQAAWSCREGKGAGHAKFRPLASHGTP